MLGQSGRRMNETEDDDDRNEQSMINDWSREINTRRLVNSRRSNAVLFEFVISDLRGERDLQRMADDRKLIGRLGRTRRAFPKVAHALSEKKHGMRAVKMVQQLHRGSTLKGAP